MKTAKFKEGITAALLVIACLVTGVSIGGLTTSPDRARTGAKEKLPDTESIYGITEFSFISADDNRMWHVTNRYNPINSNEGPGYNMSSYTFSSDSVIVINEYLGIPDEKKWDLSLTGLANGIININKNN